MPEENHRAIYTKRIIVIAPQFKTNFQKSVDMVSPAQRYKYHFKISERKNYCTRNKQHSIRLCQLFHHCVIPYLMFIKWKIIWETVSIFAYHCVKRVRMREIAGKMRTRITPNTHTFYAVMINFNLIHHELVQLKIFKTKNNLSMKLSS